MCGEGYTYSLGGRGIDMYRAAIDRFENLDIEFVQDRAEQAIVEHEFALRDGAALEAMGERARHFRFRVWFLSGQTDAAEFVAYVRGGKTVQFVHPELGALRGRIVAVEELHDDTLQRVVDIAFVEEAIDTYATPLALDIRVVSEQRFIDTQARVMESWAAKLRGALGPEASTILARVVDFDSPLAAQFADMSSTARALVATLEDNVAAIDNAMAIVELPANSVINLVDYGSGLPGRVIGSVSGAIERHATALASLRSSPARFVAALFSAVDGMITNASSLNEELSICACGVAGYHLGAIYADDEIERDRVRQIENEAAFDVVGRRVRIDDPPEIFSVNDLEQSLAAIRNRTAEAIVAIRADNAASGVEYDIPALAEIALDLQRYVSTIKLERERMISVAVDQWLPLHVLCLRQGIPYGYAERVMRVNAIANPTFTEGEVNLYVKR
jgi:prophage DNA circulation protein